MENIKWCCNTHPEIQLYLFGGIEYIKCPACNKAINGVNNAKTVEEWNEEVEKANRENVNKERGY